MNGMSIYDKVWRDDKNHWPNRFKESFGISCGDYDSLKAYIAHGQGNHMLSHCEPVSFLVTVDAYASRVFYEGKLGLLLVEDDQFALVFKLQGHVLRIAKVQEMTPMEHTVLGWQVNNISNVVRELQCRGVKFETFNGMNQDDLGIWVSPSGTKVAWFKDPDGNVLSLTQIHTSSAT